MRNPETPIPPGERPAQMSDAYRHHRARDVRVVFVPVPVGGSPEPPRQTKPAPYPRQERQRWRPQHAIPPGHKAEIERTEREAEARRMLTPRPDLLKAWLDGRAA